MKLTYWVSNQSDDHPCYNIRAKTKAECHRKRNEAADSDAKADECAGSYGPVRKVTVEYLDGFDLMLSCLEEGGGDWES